MGWFDGWPFKSKEQMDKEAKDFQERVFPFGPTQKDAALAVLQQGVKGKRVKDEEKLFAYICAKDACLLNGGELEGGLQAAETTLNKQKWIPEEDRRFILTFVRLEIRAPSLEEYPTAEDVWQFMTPEEGGK